MLRPLFTGPQSVRCWYARHSLGKLSPWVAPAVVVAGALAVRLFRLDHLPVWLDEAFTAAFSRLPWDQMVRELGIHEAHPPLYYALMHLWLGGQGTTDIWLRLPSVVFGVAMVAGLFALGGEMFGRQAGLAGASLGAIGAYAVWYSQEARMYAASACFAVWSAWALVRAIRLGGLGRWAVYVVFALLGLHTHYFFQFAVAANLASGLVLAGQESRRRSLLLAHVAVAAGWLPWFIYVLPLLREQQRWHEYLALPDMVWETWKWHMFGPAMALDPRLWTAVAGATGAATAGLMAWQLGKAGAPFRRAMVALLLWLGVPMGLVWLFSVVSRPIYGDRYMIVVLPFVYLLAVVPIAGAPGWPRYAGSALFWTLVAANLWSLGWYWYHPNYGKWDDFRTIARHIEAQVQPGDVLVENDDDQSLRYYLYDAAAVPLPWVMVPAGGGSTSRAEVDREIRDVAAQYHRLWLTVRSTRGYWDPGGLVEKWLRAHCPLVSQDQFGRVQVLLFRAGPACAP